MHDQAYEVRVKEAYKLAIARALKKRLPLEVAKDIAQDVVVSKHECLFTAYWVKTIEDCAIDYIRKAVKEFNKEERVKDVIKFNGKSAVPNESSKSYVRNLAETGLIAREWQVVHSMYWNNNGLREVGRQLDMHPMAVSRIHERALAYLRQVLVRDGVTKENYHEWYYKGL